MFKFLVFAFLVVLAVAQGPSQPATPTAPTAPASGPVAPTTPPTATFTPAKTQSYVLAAEVLTGSYSCAVGTYYQNVLSATLSFGDLYVTKTSYTTGVCTNTTAATFTSSSIAYSYNAGVFQSWKYTSQDCSGTPTVANLTTSCTNLTTSYGFPASSQTVAIPYTAPTFPSLPGYTFVTLQGGSPIGGQFVAAGVCLRVPNPTGALYYNSTKYTCNGASSAAAPSLFSDNACTTTAVAPPTAPVPISPPVTAAPNPYTYFYACSTSTAPVAAPNPTPSPGGSSTPGAPKAPSSAATLVLSAAAAVAAGAALLF